MKVSIVLLALFSVAYAQTHCMCGQENSRGRIVGGHSTRRNRYPWMVFIKIEYNKDTFACGGALINNRYVLTAAHCFSDYPGAKVSVHLKGHETANFFNGNSLPIPVEKVIMHEEYDAGIVFTNDIALLRLSQDVTYTIDVSPICLPFTEIKNYKNFIVSGWGVLRSDGEDPENLMQVRIPFVPIQQCNTYWYDMLEEDAHLCAGIYGKDSCQGDSGGPLMVKKDGKFYASGVVSFGRGCGSFTPGVYTKIDKYLPWIESHTRRYNYCRD